MAVKIIDTLDWIFGITGFGQNNYSRAFPLTMNKLPAPPLAVWPTLLVQTAPVLPDLKGAFSHLLFSDLPTGVQWYFDLDSLLATSEQSSILSWTIPRCFLKWVWGHCPAARPMTFDRDPDFWHWVEHCTLKCLDNLLISWRHAHIQGTQCQRQHSNPKTSLHLLHVWL